MRRISRFPLTGLALAGAAALLSACTSGGDEDSGVTFSCATSGGAVTASNTGNGVGTYTQDAERVADGRQSTFGTVHTTAGTETSKIKSASGGSFAAGSNVGALLSYAGMADSSTVTINTYMGAVPVESRSGAALTVTKTNGASPAEEYASFKATMAFDGVEILINAAGDSTYYVHELCGDSGSVPD